MATRVRAAPYYGHSVISSFAQQPVGRVLAINVLERGPSGRATRVEYVTEAGTFTSVRDGTRAALKYIGDNGLPANLLSTLFFVEPVLAARRWAGPRRSRAND